MRVLHMSIREAVFGWSREAGIRGKMSMRSQALSQKAKNCICRILIMVSQSRAGICRRKRHRFAAVRFLFVPASIADITISNRFFPNLERIEVASDSPKLSTDGQMLFSADGKELLYSLAAGNQERGGCAKYSQENSQRSVPICCVYRYFI